MALGHALHLLQDMTSPAHVRNDFVGDHLAIEQGRTLEARGEQREALEELLPLLGASGFVSRAHGFLANQDESRFGFDLSEYSSSVPALESEDPMDPFDAWDFWQRSDPASLHLGAAEVVNRHFFSRNTILDDIGERFGYEAPAVPSCGNVGESKTVGGQRVWVATLPPRRIDGSLAYVDPRPEFWRFLSSAQVPHLAKCRFHSVIRPGENEPRPGTPDQAWVIEESVQRDYLEILLAMAIDHTAKFLEFFLSPRLEVVPLNSREFKLANLTLLPFSARQDSIELVYETLDGGREREVLSCGGGGEFTLGPAGQPGEQSAFKCALPESLEVTPANRADFWIVVRGQHGARGELVEADEADDEWSTKDYVVAFDHVRGSEILYGGFSGDCSREPADPASDAACQLDIYSVEIDPTRERSELSVSVNLTEEFRLQASSPERVDFSHPAPQPFGDTIALRSDLGTSLAASPFAPQGLHHDVHLLEEAPDGSSSTLVPVQVCEPSIECRSSHGRLVASWIGWAPEGDTLFFYEIPWDAPSGLFRHSLASGVSVELTQLQFSDPLLVEPPEGYEREYCDESFTPFSVRSQNELAVMARCYRERVTEVRGPNDYDTETVRRGWDVFSVIPTLNPVFNEVKNQPHKRVDMQSQQVTDCGTEAVCGETTDDEFELFPAWSSDGRQLAFLRKRRAVDDHDDLVANNLGKELFVADVYVDGSMSVRKLLELGENEGYIVNPTWSPGGDWIAFTLWSPSQQEGLGEIYIVRTDEGSGQPPRRVTKGIRTANTLSWRATTPLVLP